MFFKQIVAPILMYKKESLFIIFLKQQSVLMHTFSQKKSNKCPYNANLGLNNIR